MLTKTEAAVVADLIDKSLTTIIKYDVCEISTDWLCTLMNAYQKLKAKPEPKPEPAAEKKPAANRKYDRGKVLALRQAGWTVKSIADELKCTEQTVRNILKDERDNVTNMQ